MTDDWDCGDPTCPHHAVPSPALTREALAAALAIAEVGCWGPAGLHNGNSGDIEGERFHERQADAILRALGTPPPAPTSTREELR